MITEFTNSGICAGIAATNLATDPEHKFAGYISAHSTYGSFSYLGYGLMRLLSQLAQDSDIKVGKVLWIAGHSGPETAEDSRTHFGIFAPGVTQLFPAGQVINLHPWEHNEVAPAMGAALATDAPIIILHLTRPAIEIPDRKALGIESHMMAAKGAYVMRQFDDRPRAGTLLVQGTSVVNNTVRLIPWLNAEGPNMKIVCCVSRELFQLQTDEYKNSVLPKSEWQNSMVATTSARRNMGDWIWSQETEPYTLSADFDDRWRTGGTVDEVIAEAHLDVESIKSGILRFVDR
jgi:transketolase